MHMDWWIENSINIIFLSACIMNIVWSAALYYIGNKLKNEIDTEEYKRYYYNYIFYNKDSINAFTDDIKDKLNHNIWVKIKLQNRVARFGE